MTSPAQLAALDAQLAACDRRAGRASHPLSFQVLLRVEIKDDQPVASTYVTHHDLPMGPSVEANPAPARR